MKKLALLTLLSISYFITYAQFPENFNTKCATATTPSSWLIFNPMPGTSPAGAWNCTPTEGRPVTTGGTPTPGMMCTGFYGGINHLDTSYLVSPKITTLTSANYPGGKVYMRFDTKKDNLANASKITLIKIAYDTAINPLVDSPVNSGMILPDFGDEDASDWVTHEVDLSTYIDRPPFYIAFRYISTAANGTIWYLDNVYVTMFSLNVDNEKQKKHILPVYVIGNSTSSHIELSYTAQAAGTYRVAIYDMMGRNVYNNDIEVRSGRSVHAIDGLSLRPGLYSIRMGNETAYGTTKLQIQ